MPSIPTMGPLSGRCPRDSHERRLNAASAYSCGLFSCPSQKRTTPLWPNISAGRRWFTYWALKSPAPETLGPARVRDVFARYRIGAKMYRSALAVYADAKKVNLRTRQPTVDLLGLPWRSIVRLKARDFRRQAIADPAVLRGGKWLLGGR